MAKKSKPSSRKAAKQTEHAAPVSKNTNPHVESPEASPTPAPEVQVPEKIEPQPSAQPNLPSPPEKSPITTDRRFQINGRRMIIIGIVLLVVVGILQFVANRQTNDANGFDPATQKLVSEVSKLAVLPQDEKPTVTTVVDTSKLNQSFLLNAKNGDKVLLYFQAGKAYVYRPSTKQIVNIGPLTQPTSKIFLRNGTAAATMPPAIREKLGQTTDYTIVSQDAAINQKYAKTLVIDIAGNRPDIATRIARQINGTVAILPEGESPPDADFLIIAGADSL